MKSMEELEYSHIIGWQQFNRTSHGCEASKMMKGDDGYGR